MVRIQYSLIRKFHPYHLVDPSPWPYLLATNMFLTAVGAALYLHTSFIYLLFLGLFLVSVILFCWFRDIIREGSYQGKYTIKVLRGLKYGFILFIVSEVFFFCEFFLGIFSFIIITCYRNWCTMASIRSWNNKPIFHSIT